MLPDRSHRAICCLGIFFCLVVNADVHSQSRSIDRRLYHLRTGDIAEWKNFKGVPQKSLLVHFKSSQNVLEYTLGVRQLDVRQTWTIELNGIHLGNLQEDEQDMLSYFAIPPGILKNGINELQVRQDGTIADDISTGEFILASKPLTDFLREVTVQISVTDQTLNNLIPAHLTLVNTKHSLQPLLTNPDPLLAVRTGCIYTGTGKATFTVPAGSYTLYAGRGSQYGIDSIKLSARPGDTLQRSLSIEKELPLEGWISSDTHIHTLSYSGHGDATMTERIVSLAGEGIELPVITEHNRCVDIDSLSRALNLRRYFTPISGTEYTTPVGHFNVFPWPADSAIPVSRVNDWNTVAQNLKTGLPGRVIILNHARDLHDNFRPFDTKRHLAIAGLDLSGWKFPANCMEVINSSSQQFDILQLYRDWFGMMNRGIFLTPVGSSDSHDVSRYMVGQARTYIHYRGKDPADIDTKDIVSSLSSGAVMVSFGIVAEMVINDRYGPGSLAPAQDHPKVAITVSGPTWAEVDSIFLFANGRLIRQEKINTKKGVKGIKWQQEWTLPATQQDQCLVAIATGPDPAKPYWRVPKPYQPTSTTWVPRIAGSSGAIWIDADGDKKKNCSYDYASKLLTAYHDDMAGLIATLESYDESVTVEAAASLWEKGALPSSTSLDKLLIHAAPAVRHGFELFWNHLNKAQKTFR